MRRGVEDGEHCRVHLDGHVLRLKQLLVARVDLLADPGLEGPTDERVDDVDHVLPRELEDLILWRQRLCDDGIDLGKSEKVGDGKAFELRDVVDFDVVGLDDRLLSLSKIS